MPQSVCRPVHHKKNITSSAPISQTYTGKLSGSALRSNLFSGWWLQFACELQTFKTITEHQDLSIIGIEFITKSI